MPKYSIDQLSRILTNLYSRAFEQGEQGPIRNAITQRVNNLEGFSVWGSSGDNYGASVLSDDPGVFITLNKNQTTVQGHNPGTDNYGKIDGAGSLTTPSWYVLPASTPNITEAQAFANAALDGSGGTCLTLAPSTARYAMSRQISISNFTSWTSRASATFEAIIKTSLNDANLRIICGWAGAFSAGLPSDTAFFMAIKNGLLTIYSSDGTLSAGSSIADGVAHHVAVTRSYSGVYTFYVDGASVGTQTFTAGTAFTIASTDFWVCGGYSNAGGSNDLAMFSGSLNHTAFYDYALEAHRIAAHYNCWRTQISGVITYPDVVFLNPPRARYYTALTTAGSDNDNEPSAYGFATGITATYNAAVCNATTMWGVVRLRPTWAFGTPPTTPTIFRWADNANNRLILSFSGGNWTFSRLNGGAGASAVVAGSHVAYADITVAFYCNATTVGVSLNGGAWQTAGNTSIPTLAAASFDIGNGDNPSNSSIHWMLLGLGTLSATDLATLHALGNYDPDWKDVPNINTLDPSFNWPGKSSAHLPTGGWGASAYS